MLDSLIVIGIIANPKLVKATDISHCRSSFVLQNVLTLVVNIQTVWQLEGSHRSFGGHFNTWGTLSLPCTTIVSAIWKVYSSARCTCILPSIQKTQSPGLDASQLMEENYGTHVRLQHARLSCTFVRSMIQVPTTPTQSTFQWWIRLHLFGARRLKHWKRQNYKHWSTLSCLPPSTWMPSTPSTRIKN